MEPLPGLTGHCCAKVSAKRLLKSKWENIARLKRAQNRLLEQRIRFTSFSYLPLLRGKVGMLHASNTGWPTPGFNSVHAHYIVAALRMPHCYHRYCKLRNFDNAHHCSYAAIPFQWLLLVLPQACRLLSRPGPCSMHAVVVTYCIRMYIPSNLQ